MSATVLYMSMSLDGFIGRRSPPSASSTRFSSKAKHPTHKIEGVRWLNELPLGFRLYFWFWTLFVPAGVALLLAGAVVPGLVLLALFVLDQAIFVPLIVARRERQRRAGSAQD